MRERPILFSGGMVRAILAGTKTVTRRVIRPEWSRCLDLDDAADREKARASCPYGAAGDRLWVRETWTHLTGNGIRVAYRADGDPPMSHSGEPAWPGPWRPSIFMKRADSRVLLEITDVRVERLQEITEEDARAEGAGLAYRQDGPGTFAKDSAREAFRILWDGINGDRATWASNPWVWRIGFRRVEASR